MPFVFYDHAVTTTALFGEKHRPVSDQLLADNSEM